MLKTIFYFILVLTSTLGAGTINIAVAANASFVINDLKKEFNKSYPDIKINVTLGSSGKLTAQIKNSAPYELFMSANMKYPNALYHDKIAVTKPRVYSQGRLSILSSTKIEYLKDINFILNSSIDKIAVANPKTAPYGMATIEALKNAGIYNKVKDKLVYAESISQTVAYTVLATDLGFVSKSSLYSPRMSKYKKNIHWIDVDTRLYTPIEQGIVILKNGKNSKDVKKFYNFILSSKAKKIFIAFGYKVTK